MRTPLLAALLLGVAATPALAQDAPFTGFRVEAHLGYDNTSLQLFDRDDFPELDDVDDDANESGLLYGAGIGFDYDFGQFVGGLEASLDFTTAESDFEVEGEDLNLGLDFERDIEISARAGAKLNPTTLAYGKVGYTNLKVDGEGPFFDEADADGDATEGELDGLRLGAGVEFALAPTSFAKVEYRYSNYEADVSRNQVLAGIGLRF